MLETVIEKSKLISWFRDWSVYVASPSNPYNNKPITGVSGSLPEAIRGFSTFHNRANRHVIFPGDHLRDKGYTDNKQSAWPLIYKGCRAMVLAASVVLADCRAPSSGVGWEVCFAQENDTPVIALVDDDTSSMIMGTPVDDRLTWLVYDVKCLEVFHTIELILARTREAWDRTEYHIEYIDYLKHEDFEFSNLYDPRINE